MKTIQDLIKDEQEAITGYNLFLDQEGHSRKVISEIRKIISQEKMHIRILKKKIFKGL